MSQSIICLGAHVFDVQVRPVQAIPDGQGATLVEQIRFSPAGTAAWDGPHPGETRCDRPLRGRDRHRTDR